MTQLYVLYAAKSTADTNDSIGSQLKALREHVERQGGEIAGEFSDEAASGFRRSRGPGLKAAKQQAAEAAAANPDDVVLLVFASDRLARGDGTQAMHLVEHLLEARKARYRLDSITDRLDDLVMTALIGERNYLDSKTKGEHIKRGRRKATQQHGRRNGGPRPYGYEHKVFDVDPATRKAVTRLTPVAKEAEVVNQIFREFVGGKSQAAIARDLNADGITTAKGARWHQSQVSARLRSRLYIGEVVSHGEWFPGEHEPIIDPDLFDAAQRLLRGAPTHRGGRPSTSVFLLGHGMLKCGFCGSAMRVRNEKPSTRRGERWRTFYECMGRRQGSSPDCPMPAIPRVDIDPHVLAYFADVALDVDATIAQITSNVEQERAVIRAHGDAADAEAAKAKERLDRVKRDYQDGKLDPDDWNEQRTQLNEELLAAEAEVERWRTREADLDEEASQGDAERDALEFLAALRAAIAGGADDAEAVAAASRALRTVFHHFVLHYRPAFVRATRDDRGVIDEELDAAMDAELEAEWARMRTPVVDVDLDLCSHYIEPIPRDEAVVQPWRVEDEQMEVLRKVAISRSASGRKPQLSER